MKLGCNALDRQSLCQGRAWFRHERAVLGPSLTDTRTIPTEASRLNSDVAKRADVGGASQPSEGINEADAIGCNALNFSRFEHDQPNEVVGDREDSEYFWFFRHFSGRVAAA
jgi:hypothetical protein